jgi:hypothetical protein
MVTPSFIDARLRFWDVLAMNSGAMLALVSLAIATGCAQPAHPAASPDRCKGVYKPPICAGVDRRCETDDNGCERCTCDALEPMAPGPGEP